MLRNCYGHGLAAAGLGVLLLGAASCTDGALNAAGVPDVTVSALHNTGAAEAADLDVQVMPASGGFAVTVAAGHDTPNLDDLFVAVDYDESLFHAEQLSCVTTEVTSTLGLAVETAPGTIEAGFTGTHDESLGTAPGSTLLSFMLKPGRAGKAVSSAAQGSGFRARNLELVQAEDAWTLSWDYTNPGDTNQDGEVGLPDLTMIGKYFQEQLGSTVTDPRRNVDGDRNGEINAADITPIGSNYSCDVVAYKIQMSPDGINDFITVGELLLSEQNASPTEAVRFSYTFGVQYVPGAWYRVRPQSSDLSLGEPSEAISDTSRQLADVSSVAGQKFTIVGSVHNLPAPLAQMNAVRLVYPASYTYVAKSFNMGSPGGARDDVDGLWSTFATTALFPPEALMQEQMLPDGRKCLDLNVTVNDRQLPESPAGYGDLFNLQLQSDSGEPLSLQVQLQSEDGIRRTYYTDAEDTSHAFGNSLSVRPL